MWLVSRVAAVSAGAGGSGSRISMSCFTSFRGGMGSEGLAAGMARTLAGMGGIQNERETIQSLSDCLAFYLARVRSLETKNWKLESKIREHLEKKGPQVRDWSHYFKTIEDLRAQIFTNTVDSAHIVLQIDNAHLAADDFRVIDDTNVTRLQLETDIKALKEELLLVKKNHEEEVKGLQAHIASSGLIVDDKLPWKNQEKLDKYWFQQIEESTTVVTTQSAEVGAAEMSLTDLKQTVQSLEINLDSMRNLKASLEHSLREEWEALLNIKVKLEAEIATYRRLLEDGKDFNLGDVLDSSNSMQTIEKTTISWIVDGKVVSETNTIKILRH
ncbi:Keratin, type I cytoskeletal 18 [Saguinus oedipus]|uniref:Keratin, type I cytoskeletal 18 n=1 Tax=Saguinus oedipus TaxID=9490 RepID=A0ABQ9W3U6_SAGOE|nr:Keratin, type I cytoskeletal 18 [Saguinus oedipus]